jgi:cytochrome c oxidase subunit 3
MSHNSSSPDFLHHHFHDVDQQYQTSKFGMWAFILTEVLTFGGLFVAYTVYRSWYPEMFYDAHLLLDVQKGMLNTIVLISSSLTMALAIWAIQKKNKKLSLWMLVITWVLALGFLGIKYLEYSHKFEVGQLPGIFYSYMGPEVVNIDNPHIFFGIYFIMTGLHGLHVAIGMGLIAWLIYLTKKDKLHSEYYTPMETVGIFWHLVDLIWIYLFPLFYLIG